MSKDTAPCNGCRCDFYNGRKNFTGDECWSLKKAKLVTRHKLGWWSSPTEKGNFTEVKVYDCHHAPGHYALYERRPSFAA